MLLGYARVSTDDQDLTHQRASLTAAGCQKIYAEKISGAKRGRPQLERLLGELRDDDVVVVTRLDRLARSTRDLLDIAERLNRSNAGLRSIAEPWADTTSPAGRMVLTVFAGIAEFERALIHDRTSAGRSAARQNGVRFGRPPALNEDQMILGARLLDEGKKPGEVARVLKVHPATIYRVLRSSLARPE
jgi:DNA invertase Pin-like site-specific DNA recombinase